MFSVALRAVDEVFGEAKPNGDFGRIQSAYDDVEALAVLYRDQEPRAHWDGQAMPDDAASAMFTAGRTADALHRAVIQAACVATTILLHEAFDHPQVEVSIKRFLATDRARMLREQQSWSQLYCLTVYRNKLIVHHEVPRMSATMTSANGVRRLVPLRRGFQVDDADLQALYALRDRTGVAPGETNYFQLLTALFYGVPVSFGSSQPGERRTVDAIAERGGVDSLSVDEITTALGSVLGDLRVLCGG